MFVGDRRIDGVPSLGQLVEAIEGVTSAKRATASAAGSFKK